MQQFAFVEPPAGATLLLRCELQTLNPISHMTVLQSIGSPLVGSSLVVKLHMLSSVLHMIVF